ncbi:MAG: HAMP domain-containing protein [Streptosporangiales bacterium]|nr:HAMP domain-containing protein [Streptosporangiales bacterium]
MSTAGHGLARRARRLAGRQTRQVRAVAARLIRHWRRSLQFRVVVSTLAVSCLVVGLLGWFLVARIQEGLLDEKMTAATEEAWSGTLYAQGQLVALDTRDPQALESLQAGVVNELNNRSGTAGRYYVAVRAGARDVPAGANLARATGGVSLLSIPGRLRDAVEAAPALEQRRTYTEIRYSNGDEPQPAIVVGSKVGPWQLYYLFPLDQEQETLGLVQRTVALVGAALVALLCAIAYLVTRQVVTPVRLAARTAGEFEAGHLAERMHVRGEDDLARLATSFNSMAASLERQIGELEELGRVQRRFVSDVSHELRTPLTTVRMAADMLYHDRDRLTGDAARAAELLQAQLDRFESLLADLLEISRYDAGAVVLDAGPSDVRDLVRAAVEGNRPLAEQAGSAITVDLPDEPCVAEIDTRRVDRILRNLVGNAINYGEDGAIEITVGVDEQAVAVVVRDHGVGLDPEEAERVFDRFWRADPARARGAGGTGLGLAIASEDAHLHAGWLQATGGRGYGALFRLTLPVAAGAVLDGSPLPMDMPDVPQPQEPAPDVADAVEEPDSALPAGGASP